MNDILPFTDTKEKGAADFYFCINATFAHIQRTFAEEGLHRYWEDLGRDWMSPVWMRWREGGLDAVAEYMRRSFEVEPGADVIVERHPESVEVEVRTCPALAHLRASGRAPIETYCHHCYVVMNAAARCAGLAVRLEGGNGSCRQWFGVADGAADQDLMEIRPCVMEADDAGNL